VENIKEKTRKRKNGKHKGKIYAKRGKIYKKCV
jgi:hypothetical protein